MLLEFSVITYYCIDTSLDMLLQEEYRFTLQGFLFKYRCSWLFAKVYILLSNLFLPCVSFINLNTERLVPTNRQIHPTHPPPIPLAHNCSRSLKHQKE